MKGFYTNVSRYGSRLLVRGINDKGIRYQDRINFGPTLFVPSDKGEFKAVDGTNVAKMEFDTMKEAREFQNMYKDIDNFKIYGNTNYVAQYIQKNYPGQISYDSKFINVTKIDIEVHAPEFPEPIHAAYPVSAITIENNIDNTFYVWGTQEFDIKHPEVLKEFPDAKIVYKQCENEAALLLDFIYHWAAPANTPDVITGWNSAGFDIPYLINRIIRIHGEDFAKKLSPWNNIREKRREFNGQEIQEWHIEGVSHLDYMDVFKKFTVNTLGTQESYRLDHIAHVVLGDRKLSYEEAGSLHQLYETNHQKYILYNIQDTNLITRIDNKLGLIELIFTMAYKAGVNYGDTLGTVGIWDSIIYRYLDDKGIVVPPNKNHHKEPFAGGYVKDPVPGLYRWVVSFDFASLYPSIMRQFNISPETILPTQNVNIDVQTALDKKAEIVPGYANAPNGALYKREEKGFIPELVGNYYADRKVIKKEMIKCEQEIEKVKNVLRKRGVDV